MDATLKDKLGGLPTAPGVYEMLDQKGKLIYVGKARNLKNRVGSYFTGVKDAKTTALVDKIRDVTWTITTNEIEALILEANLIREHRPRYNIILRDDKHYPYLKINLNKPYPKVEVVRRKVDDGSAYFGPYASIGGIRTILNIIESLFPLRTCSDREMDHRSRPCLQYQIHRCLAPCMDYITPEAYGLLIQEVLLLLSGKEKELVRRLKIKMQEYSATMAFEQAAKVRDQLVVIGKLTEAQIIDKGHAKERDVIGLYRGDKKASIMVFFIRDGNISAKEHYYLEHQEGAEDGDILQAFLEQFYANRLPGRELILAKDPSDLAMAEAFLRFRKGLGVSLVIPKRGEKLKLLALANDNAQERYRQEEETQRRKEQEIAKGLLSLGEYLELPKSPKRIECYDISNISGTHTVASMVVFTDGRPDKGQYRKFKIRTVEGPNDFASMEEVLKRRLGMELPVADLMIIDGGKGQLSSARTILKEAGFGDVPVFGLAKKEELLFQEGRLEPIFIPRQDKALLLLKEIRDEAHRFAITYHRSLRDKEMIASVFDEISGIGPKRKKALLQAFGSLRGIRRASLDDIIKVVGSRNAAEKVKDTIGDEQD